MARPIKNTDGKTLRDFVGDSAVPGATVYTDEHSGYAGIPNPHGTVTHSEGQYVDGDIHVNSMEEFWSLTKRGFRGTFHKWERKARA